MGTEGGIWEGAETGPEFSLKELEGLARKIESERNLDCSQFRPSYFRRRVVTRVKATGSDGVRDYMRLLDRSGEEWDRLLDALTVNVTSFFRDAEVWEYLRERVLPRLAEEKRARGRRCYLRIWSAGCSSGQEPYSLAILLRELGVGADEKVIPKITATDYDRQCLTKARGGTYSGEEMNGLSAPYRAKYAVPVGNGFRMSEELRRMIRFVPVDLFGLAGQRIMDLVVLRNVIMYFSKEQQEKIVGKTRDALNPGGYLVLGKSEKLPPRYQGDFVHESLPQRVYRKKSAEEAR